MLTIVTEEEDLQSAGVGSQTFGWPAAGSHDPHESNASEWYKESHNGLRFMYRISPNPSAIDCYILAKNEIILTWATFTSGYLW